MMHILRFTLLVALLLGSSLASTMYAQKIAWGTLGAAESKNYYPQIVGEDDDKIFTYHFLKGACYLESYGKGKMQRLSSKKIELSRINGNRPSIERVNFVGNKYIVFTSYYDRETKESKILAQTVDAHTQQMSESIVLFDVPVESRRRSGEYYVFLSQDRNKILVNHYAYYKKQRQYKDKFKLVDANLNVLLDREDVYDKGERDFRISNYLIDNDGSLYFLKSYGAGQKYIVSYDANREYEKWEEQLDVSKLGLERNSRITDLTFSVNRHNDLIVSGYYSEEKNNLDGCFFLKIDNESKETEVTRLNKFDDSFKEQFTRKHWLFDDKQEVFNDFKSITIINKEDGGILLAGEKYQRLIVSSNYGTTTYETFGDLIVLNIAPSGDLLWANRIPKLQKFNDRYFNLLTKDARTTDYYSYLIGLDEQKAVVLFNDHRKNAVAAEQGSLKALKNINKSFISSYTIDLQTGEKQKGLISNAQDSEVLFKPSTSYQKDQHSDIIIFGRKHKRFKYGTLVL